MTLINLLLASMSIDGSPDPFAVAGCFGIAATVLVMILLPFLLLRERK
jgi:hypothetical protein